MPRLFAPTHITQKFQLRPAKCALPPLTFTFCSPASNTASEEDYYLAEWSAEEVGCCTVISYKFLVERMCMLVNMRVCVISCAAGWLPLHET